MGELVQVRPGLPKGSFVLQQPSKSAEQLPNPDLSGSWCSSAHPLVHPERRATRCLERAWVEGSCGHSDDRSVNPYHRPQASCGTFHRWGTEGRGTGERWAQTENPAPPAIQSPL